MQPAEPSAEPALRLLQLSRRATCRAALTQLAPQTAAPVAISTRLAQAVRRRQLQRQTLAPLPQHTHTRKHRRLPFAQKVSVSPTIPLPSSGSLPHTHMREGARAIHKGIHKATQTNTRMPQERTNTSENSEKKTRCITSSNRPSCSNTSRVLSGFNLASEVRTEICRGGAVPAAQAWSMRSSRSSLPDSGPPAPPPSPDSSSSAER